MDDLLMRVLTSTWNRENRPQVTVADLDADPHVKAAVVVWLLVDELRGKLAEYEEAA